MPNVQNTISIHFENTELCCLTFDKISLALKYNLNEIDLQKKSQRQTHCCYQINTGFEAFIKTIFVLEISEFDFIFTIVLY